MLDGAKMVGRPQEGFPPSDPGANGSEPAFDRIVALAADLFDAPMALLLVVERGRTVVRAEMGLGAGWAAGASLPSLTPSSDVDAVVVPDATLDPRFRRHPLVAGPPHVRFFAGVSLPSSDPAATGMLCALDSVARVPSSSRDMGRLRALAALAVACLDRRPDDRDALADAKAVAAAKSDLLADVSHEMRTPLNGIVGFTTLLKRDGALDPDALRTVERIEEAGRGLLSIVGDALDLSKLEAGAVRLDLRPFSPRRLVEEAVALVGTDADRKGLQLLVDLPDALVGPLVGDSDKLRQVLLNLLSNAIKFTSSGSIRVSLACGSDSGPGSAVALSIAVEDSGVGLEADDIPRLFRRFTQGDGAVSRRFGGTGLGLAISKKLVDAMGGAIAVQSSPGLGSRFSVAMTLRRAADPRPQTPSPADDTRGAIDGLKGLAILLADDVPMNQKLVQHMLAPLGAEVDVVADGAEAIAAVGRRDYALVLMDMEMPVLGGLDATRQIRAMGGSFADLPIVALTANVFPEQLDLCRQAGMDDHLAKPFGPDDLAATALRWARRRTQPLRWRSS